jgi:hypothetical protein
MVKNINEKRKMKEKNCLGKLIWPKCGKDILIWEDFLMQHKKNVKKMFDNYTLSQFIKDEKLHVSKNCDKKLAIEFLDGFKICFEDF